MSQPTPSRGRTTVRTFPYPDTAAVAAFMNAFGQPVRTTPTDDLPADEAELRVRLVVEEAIEFADAMGYSLVAPDGAVVGKKDFEVVATGAGIDLVESADALADLTVVVKGSAHTLGIDIDSTFIAVHETNMAKMDPVTGKPIRDARGKVTKPEGWQPPTEAIKALLIEDGWTPSEPSAPSPVTAPTAAPTPVPSPRIHTVAAERRLHRNGD